MDCMTNNCREEIITSETFYHPGDRFIKQHCLQSEMEKMHITVSCSIYMPCSDSHSQTMAGPNMGVPHLLGAGILVLPHLHHCVSGVMLAAGDTLRS